MAGFHSIASEDVVQVSGHNDRAVHRLIEIIKKLEPEGMRALNPVYGVPYWGVSYETTGTGFMVNPVILEDFIVDELKEYFPNSHPELQIDITEIEILESGFIRRRVQISYKELSLLSMMNESIENRDSLE